MRNLTQKVSCAPSFRYIEFVRSDTALRLGIDNTPNEEQWQKIELLAQNVLQPIRNHFGRIRVTSGFRCPELCLAIGSYKMINNEKVVTSNHAKGEAADVEPLRKGVSLIDVIEWTYKNLEFRTLILEYPPYGWIHVDYRESGNLKRLKLKDRTNNYTDVTVDFLKSLYK